MYQEGDVAQGDAAALTSTGDKHHLSGAQDFIVEQCACNPGVPRGTENKVVDACIVIVYRCPCRVALHFKRAVGRCFIAEQSP